MRKTISLKCTFQFFITVVTSLVSCILLWHVNTLDQVNTVQGDFRKFIA